MTKKPSPWRGKDLLEDFPDPASITTLSAELAPILAGNHPATVGGALAECAATHIVSHDPRMRGAVLANFLRLMLRIMPLCEHELLLKDRMPKHWRTTKAKHMETARLALKEALAKLTPDGTEASDGH